MIRVVGLDKAKVRKTACGACANILSYAYIDVQTLPFNIYLITCPTCGSKIEVDEFKRPANGVLENHADLSQ